MGPLSGARLGGALGGDAHISKVWSGFKKECCTDADNFQATLPLALAPDCAQLACTFTLRGVLTSQVVFPAQADTLDRANLLGATVLLDFSFFETQNQV